MSQKVSTITIPRKRILDTLDERGWTKGEWGTDGGPVCLHGAIRLCDPRDATLIERVWQWRGYGTDWNDKWSTTEQMVREYVLDSDPITDEELRDTFGPQWEAMVALVRRASQLTEDEAKRLYTAWFSGQYIAWFSGQYTAWSAAEDAARGTARNAGQYVTQYAAKIAAKNAAKSAAKIAAKNAAGDAAVALSVRHLIGKVFTQEHYDLLTEPWREVIGPVHPDDVEG